MAGGVLLLTGRAHKRPGDARAQKGGMARRAGAGGGVEGVAGAGDARGGEDGRKDESTKRQEEQWTVNRVASLRLCVFPPPRLTDAAPTPPPSPPPRRSR